jgi:hypothetical protein
MPCVQMLFPMFLRMRGSDGRGRGGGGRNEGGRKMTG